MKVKDTFFGGAEKKAGKKQSKEFKRASKLTAEQLKQTEAEISPFISRGGGISLAKQQAISGALGNEAQAEAFSNFQEDPGTQFLREQGLRLIDSGAGAGGSLGGGDRLRELTKFSQGLALQDLGNRFNRLGVTSAGEEAVTARQQNAATQLGGIRSGVGAQQAGLITGQGAASAAGITGQAAGLRSGITDVVKIGASLSDERLKTNKRKIGEYHGHNLYSWNWNSLARVLFGLVGPSVGVMSKEVMKINPDAVIIRDDGYRMVKYGEL